MFRPVSFRSIKQRLITIRLFWGLSFFFLMLMPGMLNAQCGPVISTFPYSEGFETSAAWTTGVVSGTNNWAWGTPSHPTINSAGGGLKSWCVGGLTGSSYVNSAQCWIMSPCFDFTNLNKPWISFKIFWECERQWDGMVLQYSLNGGSTWSNVGAFGDPVDCLNDNWFNYGNITWLNSIPAGTRHGWSGRIGPTAALCTGGFGSGAWVTAKHCMPYLANQPSVRFRFLFGSGTSCNAFDGIAVDDIFIDNVPPNTANFSYTCNGSAVSFTNLSSPCPVSYTWNFGDPGSGPLNTSTSTNPSHTYGTGGVYNVTLTADGPCAASGTVTIPIHVVTATAVAVNPTCNGANNGSATVTPAGTGPYTYLWSPGGQTTATATGLSPGVYTVTVTDATSPCPATATVNIIQPPVLTASLTSGSVLCNGGSTTANAVPSGGTGPYTYAWTPTGGSSSASSPLQAGTYTCTITDAHGCVVAPVISITQPAALSTTVSAASVLCNGGTTTASIAVSGGTAAYAYSWSPSGGNASTSSPLQAGSYTCNVTDANGCSTTQAVTITQPAVMNSAATIGNILCNGGTTTAAVSVNGGTGPYAYSWSPSGGTGSSSLPLTAGTYTCFITDANGCSSSQVCSITQPSSLTLASSVSSSTCNNANGSATLTITGGSPGYTCNWAPSGASGIQASGLSAGTQTVTVTDVNGCVSSLTVVISNASMATLSLVSQSNVSCYGGTNASVSVLASGGPGPYLYAWQPAGGNQATASNLSAGTYTCTLTDGNGCPDTMQVVITQPADFFIASGNTNVSCAGQQTGSAYVNVSGATPSYSYSWLPAGGNNATSSPIFAGTYTCVITDANGCQTSQSFAVTEPLPLTVSFTVTPSGCANSCDAQMAAVVSGGTPGYTYSWSSGCNTATCQNVCAGTYILTANDVNGCTVSSAATVGSPAAINISFTSSDAHCNQSDGNTVASASGGTGTFVYQWSGGPASATWNAIAAGTYTVVATDQAGCSDTATVLINNLPGVSAAIGTMIAPSCFDSSDGSIIATTSGGNGPYVYSWTAPAISSSQIANNLTAGSYTLTVTDADGCVSVVSATLTQPSVLVAAAAVNPSAVCAGSPVQISASASGGTASYNYVWNPGNMNGAQQTITPVSSSGYTVYVTDANGCADSSSVQLQVNALPVVSFSADSLTGCAPFCLQFSDSSSSPSSALTQWLWDFGDNQTSSLQAPSHCYQSAGNYSVQLTVTNASGCVSAFSIPAYIQVLAQPVADFSADPQPASYLNPEITFTNLSSGASSWLWDFGDFQHSVSTLENPVFNYSDADCYPALLTAYNALGCADTAMHEICISEDYTLYVPNSFTPNHDGINDVFLPQMTGLNESGYKLMVFDRWGNLIFESRQFSQGWDGRVKNHSEICQMDTYVWRIEVPDMIGEWHYFVGIINLIR